MKNKLKFLIVIVILPLVLAGCGLFAGGGGTDDPNPKSTYSVIPTVTAITGNKKIYLSWDEPNEVDFSGVEITVSNMTTPNVLPKGTTQVLLNVPDNQPVTINIIARYGANRSDAVVRHVTPGPLSFVPVVTGVTENGIYTDTLMMNLPSNPDFQYEVKIDGAEYIPGSAYTQVGDHVLVITATHPQLQESVQATVHFTLKKTVTDLTPPGEVSVLSAQARDGAVQLSWSDPADPDFSQVEISGSGFPTVTIPKGTRQREISGLINGTAYVFKLITIDESGNRSNGNQIGCVPKIPNGSVNLNLKLYEDWVESITINKTELTLSQGNLFHLLATVLPKTANPNVVWNSSDTRVAIVDEDGQVVAVGKGSATLTAISETDSTKQSACQITVQ